MVGKLKRIFKKLIFKYRCDSKTYIEFLRRGGAEIGERVIIYDPQNTIIDATRPFMIKIGNDVQITSGVTMLTHGYDWSVIKGQYGEVMGSCGEIVIGNNCFIGMHTTILKGVHIGNNCIIGANSLVNKNIPDGYVAAGNPAKPIMTVEEYRKKRMKVQLAEAEKLYRCYVERVGKEPGIELFDEFFWLFQKRDERALTVGQKAKMLLIGNYEQSLSRYLETEPLFDGYESFLKALRASRYHSE